MKEKHRRVSRPSGDKGRERGREADYLTFQILTVDQKYYIKNIPRTQSWEKLINFQGDWDDQKNNYEIDGGHSERFQQGFK
jgi:hypothetical protein